jgi:hypothetical protein
MKLFARMLLTAVILGVAGCATGPTVRADYDRSANFAAYRTFGFYSPLGTDKAGYQSLITQTIKSAVQSELESRGYAYTESSPDLLVNFNAKLARQTEISQMPATPMYYGYRRGFYGGWGGYAYETRVDQYTEGTLNIDIVDPKRQQLVWEGVAVGRVTKKNQEERQAAIRAAVTEIFAQYPFRAGGQ